jgi:hypothetical protein
MTEVARKTYRDIAGWFGEADRRLFSAFLHSQRDTPPGDLVEIGAFVGKSAVVIGDYLRAGERFVVVDIFGDESLLGGSDEDERNKTENKQSYPRLTRDRFEANYLSVHDELPVIVQANSPEVVNHVRPSGARFIHVDGSHLYAGVAADCRSVKQLLRPGGVVAFDDWRNAKCPGVAAAVWEAVVSDGLTPVATTRQKLYGVYEGAEDAVATVRTMVGSDPTWWVSEDHVIMGHTVVRLAPNKAAAGRRGAGQGARGETQPAGVQRATAEKGHAPRRSLVDEVLPPVLARRFRRVGDR